MYKTQSGDCCGRKLICEFSSSPQSVTLNRDKLRENLNAYHEDHEELGEDLGGHYRDLCVEVTLTDHQLEVTDKDGLSNRQVLKDEGFRQVFRFCNANSGNYCNVFMLSSNEESFDAEVQ